MAIYVAFGPPGLSIHGALIGEIRASEAIADGNSGSITAKKGEIAVVTNTGGANAYFAWGTTPDASATAKTGASNARDVLPAGTKFGVAVEEGDKFASAAS